MVAKLIWSGLARDCRMQKIGTTLNLSAGDLVGHLNCRYLTDLDLKVANGALEKPKEKFQSAISDKRIALEIEEDVARRRFG